MLELFRTNQLALSILLLFYVLLVRFPVFIVPDSYAVGAAGMLSLAVYDWLGGANGNLPNLVAAILLFLQAFYINQIVYKHRLARTNSLFPGVFYILTASLFIEFNHLSPLLLANTFYIIALGELMEIYKRKTCADRIFNAGFWLAVASLFYFSYLSLLLLGIIAIFIMRAIRINEILTLLSGSIVAYFLAGVYYFWQDRLSDFLQIQFVDNLGFLDLQVAMNWQNYLIIGVVGLFILLTFLNYSNYTIRQNIQTQKRISILSWAIITAAISFLIQSQVQIDHLLIFAVPVGIFLSFNFINMSARWAETLHLLLLIAIIVWQCKPFYLML
ncbi:MAG: hypothetical protein AB8G22_19795 [Saprospiraceae bacterium]